VRNLEANASTGAGRTQNCIDERMPNWETEPEKLLRQSAGFQWKRFAFNVLSYSLWFGIQSDY